MKSMKTQVYRKRWSLVEFYTSTGTYLYRTVVKQMSNSETL